MVRTKSVRRLTANSSGAAAIEFAILAIPLFVLIMGGIEFGFMMLVKARLEGTLQEAARMATTGNVATNGTSGEKIDAMVKSNLNTVGNMTVTIQKTFYDQYNQVHQPEEKDSAGTTPPYCWTDTNGNQQWDKDPSRTGLGGANDIINYQVTVTYPYLFPLITALVTHQSLMALTGQATLQNEPFAGGSDLAARKCCISAASGNPVTCTAP